MNLRPAFSRSRVALVAGLSLVAVLSLAVGWTAGNVAASSANHTSPSAVPTARTGAGTEIVPPGNVQYANQPNIGSGVSGASGAGGGSAGVSGSFAYPIPGYGGSLGVAPEGTILTAGTGTAEMKADGSDRAAALNKATATALADAKSQAQATALAMGVTLKSIYSVSATSSESYSYPATDCAIPLMPTSNGTTTEGGVPALAPANSPAGTRAPSPLPPVCIYNKVVRPSSSQLVVTVVVAYRFG